MAMTDISDIIVKYIDLEPINLAIKQRAKALASQLDEEAANQFISDMSSFKSSVECKGSSVSINVSPSESYLLNYLQNHSTPVSGGDGGQAHNIDGSTYESNVPKQLQGTPLPWYELPVIDGEDEIQHLIEIMAPDAVQNAVNNGLEQIKEKVIIPLVKEKLSGGV